MPRKILAAVDRPTAPPTPSVRSKNPCHAAHHRRQDAPVEQQRGEHAHDQHDRQRLKRQDEIRAGRFEVERQRAAAEIAEHEGRARARGRRNGTDGIIDDAEGMRDEGQFYECYGCNEGDGKADSGLSERNRAAVFAKPPRQCEQGKNAERRLQL